MSISLSWGKFAVNTCDMPIYGWGYLKCIGMALLGLEKWKDFSDFPCGKALPNFQLSWKKHQSMATRVPVYMPLTMQNAKNQWTECMGVHFPMDVSNWRWKLVTRSLDHKTWRKRKCICPCSSFEQNFDHILIFHFIDIRVFLRKHLRPQRLLLY